MTPYSVLCWVFLAASIGNTLLARWLTSRVLDGVDPKSAPEGEEKARALRRFRFLFGMLGLSILLLVAAAASGVLNAIGVS